MKKNSKISTRINEHKSISNNAKLSWDAIGGGINKGVAERQAKKRKRRIFIWFFFGVMAFILLFGVGFLLEEERVVSSVVTEESSDMTKDSNTESINAHASIAIASHASSPIQNKSNHTSNKIINKVDNSENKVNKQSSNNERNFMTEVKDNIVQQYDATSNDERKLLDTMNSSTDSPWISSVKKRRMLLEYIMPLELKMNSISTGMRSITTLPYVNIINDEELKSKRYFSFQVGSNFSNIGDNYVFSASELGYFLEGAAYWNIYDNLYLGAGVGYSRLNFKSEFETTQDVNIFKPETPDTLFYFNNDLIQTVYKDSIQALEIRSFRNYNSVSMVTIPIQLSYLLEYRSLQVIPAIGGSLNLWTKTTGKVSDISYNVSEFDSWSGGTIGFWGQISIGLEINNSSNVGINYRWTRYGVTDEKNVKANALALQWISKF